MTRLVVDDPLCGQLVEFDVPVELCDPAGRFLGRFVPAKSALYEQLQRDQCPYSEEELEQMHQSQGGGPLADLWRKLDAS